MARQTDRSQPHLTDFILRFSQAEERGSPWPVAQPFQGHQRESSQGAPGLDLGFRARQGRVACCERRWRALCDSACLPTCTGVRTWSLAPCQPLSGSTISPSGGQFPHDAPDPGSGQIVHAAWHLAWTTIESHRQGWLFLAGSATDLLSALVDGDTASPTRLCLYETADFTRVGDSSACPTEPPLGH